MKGEWATDVGGCFNRRKIAHFLPNGSQAKVGRMIVHKILCRKSNIIQRGGIFCFRRRIIYCWCSPMQEFTNKLPFWTSRVHLTVKLTNNQIQFMSHFSHFLVSRGVRFVSHLVSLLSFCCCCTISGLLLSLLPPLSRLLIVEKE